ncbi:MAG: SDR family oxidoreductase [Longimicrobiales bacterium]|jgi:NADP-dependent 3-hydroxy acid dehydrogenase YdfG
MPDGRLSGKVAIVTGASAGIGEAIAIALAGEGASVVLAARRLDRIKATAATIEESGGEALAVQTDVARQEDVEALAKATTDKFGRIDIVVNNAGVMSVSPMAEGRIDDWKHMVDVNINGVLHGIAAVLPTMIEQSGGHIVNIGSVAGRRPFPGGSVYAATKFAVRALSWGLHLELGAKHGIRVTDIQPGFVSTELLDTVANEAMREGWAKGWEGKRPLQPEDIAHAVLYAVTAPDHVSVSEVLVRPVDQAT